MKQWYRFDSQTNMASAIRLPFDLIYILPKRDKAHAARTFPVHLWVEPSKELTANIRSRKVKSFIAPGSHRADAVTQEGFASGKDSLGELCPELESDETAFLVPVLPLSVKKSKSQVAGYFTSKALAASLEHAQKTRPHTAGRLLAPSAKEALANLQLVVHGKAVLPCLSCDNAMARVANPNACSLGTASCLASISFRGALTFKDREKSGTSQVVS